MFLCFFVSLFLCFFVSLFRIIFLQSIIKCIDKINFHFIKIELKRSLNFLTIIILYLQTHIMSIIRSSRVVSLIQSDIKAHWYARLGGMTVYPLLSLFNIIPSSLWIVPLLWAPVCVSIHCIAINQKKECLKYELNKNLSMDHHYKYASFSVNDNKFITFHTNYPSNRSLKDIVVNTKYNNKSKTHLPIKYNNTCKNSYVFVSIPSFFLREPFQGQINDLLNLRRRNFRYNITSIIGFIILYQYGVFIDVPSISFYGPLTGIITFILAKPHDTKTQFNSVGEKFLNKKLSDLIKSDEMNNILLNIDISNCYWYLSTTGNLEITNSKKKLFFSFRRFFKI